MGIALIPAVWMAGLALEDVQEQASQADEAQRREGKATKMDLQCQLLACNLIDC